MKNIMEDCIVKRPIYTYNKENHLFHFFCWRSSSWDTPMGSKWLPNSLCKRKKQVLNPLYIYSMGLNLKKKKKVIEEIGN